MPTEEMYVGLHMALVCKDLGVLPGPGGYFDQDCVQMMYLQAGLAAIAQYEKSEAEKSKNK